MCGRNNGATTFAARVLPVWVAQIGGSLGLIQRDTAIYSLAIASNYGALMFAVCASLAELLWTEGYLKEKGEQRLLITVLWAEFSFGCRLDGCVGIYGLC